MHRMALSPNQDAAYNRRATTIGISKRFFGVPRYEDIFPEKKAGRMTTAKRNVDLIGLVAAQATNASEFAELFSFDADRLKTDGSGQTLRIIVSK